MINAKWNVSRKNLTFKAALLVLAIAVSACGTRQAADAEAAATEKKPSGLPSGVQSGNNSTTPSSDVKALSQADLDAVIGNLRGEVQVVSSPLIASLSNNGTFMINSKIAQYAEGNYLYIKLGLPGSSNVLFESPMGLFTQTIQSQTIHRFISTVRTDANGKLWALDVSYNATLGAQIQSYVVRILDCVKSQDGKTTTCGNTNSAIVFKQGLQKI